MNAAEKTTALLVLTEALCAATSIADPPPLVARLQSWMHAPPHRGDLVVETSTQHRGLDPRRVGVVRTISRHRSPYRRVTEILLLDPPCGKEHCQNPRCIHRMRWNDATFVRVPATAEQLAKALGREGRRSTIERDDLVATLVDAGFEVRSFVSDTAAVADTPMKTSKRKMWIGNLDGARQGLVIAPSKERARKIVGTSRKDFENYWALQAGIEQGLACEVLHTRPIDHKGAPWQQGRCRLIKKNLQARMS